MSPMLITVVAFLAITGLMAAVLFMGTAKSPVEQRLKIAACKAARIYARNPPSAGSRTCRARRRSHA